MAFAPPFDSIIRTKSLFMKERNYESFAVFPVVLQWISTIEYNRIQHVQILIFSCCKIGLSSEKNVKLQVWQKRNRKLKPWKIASNIFCCQFQLRESEKKYESINEKNLFAALMCQWGDTDMKRTHFSRMNRKKIMLSLCVFVWSPEFLAEYGLAKK